MSEMQRVEGTVTDRQIHELKNRLTVVKGMTQLLARHVRRADWQRERIIERVDGLQHEVEQLEVLIEQLRDRGHAIGHDSSSTVGRDPRLVDD